MKRVLVLASGLALLCGTLGAAPGCGTASSVRCMFLKGNCLSWEQYLSIDQQASPAPSVDDLLKQFPSPLAVHDRDGALRRIDYHCYSLTGDLKIAEFTFDEGKKLVKKELW